MRLTDHEVASIKAAARLTFGPEAVVRLFGSSVDPKRRAADIDLHIEMPIRTDFWKAKYEFLDRLFARIDEQRVDVIGTARGEAPEAIARIAYRDGVIL